MHDAAHQSAVRHKARQLVVDTWQSEAILSLFLTILIVIVFVFPLTNFVTQHVRTYIEISFSLMLILGTAVGRRTGKLFYVMVVFGVITLAVRWTYFFHAGASPIREALTMFDVLLLCIALLIVVLSKGHVTSTRIQGGIAVYLLVGIAWAHAYNIVAAYNPHAFVVSTGTPNTPTEWVYYSFTTLTTVGYGDIVPVTRVSRMLCMGEALFGQLYLAVLIARLVALQVSESLTSSN